MPALPLLTALRNADAASIRADLIAGTITAFMLVPQALAYAQLAGLPAQAGLLASILPTMLYALVGSSRTLSVGPVAVAALMVAVALHNFAADDPARWTAGAIILAAEGGAFLLLMRALRLGGVVHFVSHPVLYGFTSGAAILIILSQLPYLTGLDATSAASWAILPRLAAQPETLSTLTLIFSGSALLILWLARSVLARALTALGLSAQTAALLSKLSPLLLVFGAILVVTALPAEQRQQLAVVGPIPAGLPWPDFSALIGPGWVQLAPSAFLIALVGFVESMAVARVLGAKRRQKVDPDQELLALGLANLGAAGSGAMPVAGGFSRSVVNFDAGARTQLASLVSAGWVALVALFFSAAFQPLPQAILAAIIVVAVAQLIDWRSARAVFRYDRGDGISLLATLLGVLILGIEQGLLLGMGLSIALYLRRTSAPHLAVVGRVPGTEHFRNVDRRQVECTPGVLIVRIDESLYFANIAGVEARIERLLAQPATPIHTLLLVLSAVSSIDASAEEALQHWDESLAARGIQLHLAEVKGPVWDRLQHTPWGRDLDGRVHLSTHAALQALQGHPRAP